MIIIDAIGIQLIPGNCGNECPGSWELTGLDCCCDECDYMKCCLETHNMADCLTCRDPDCPHVPSQT